MYNNNVDWAQLAQQWIQMQTQFEQGEADMDVVKEEEDIERPSFDTNLTSSENKNIQSKQITTPSLIRNETQFGAEQWNSWPNRVVLPPPILHVPTTETIQSPIVPPISVAAQNSVQNSRQVSAPSSEIGDTTKRKILPAWIREGLEKMEREKQKQKKQNKDITPSPKEIIPRTILPPPVNIDKEQLLMNSMEIQESDCSGNEQDDIDGVQADDYDGENNFNSLLPQQNKVKEKHIEQASEPKSGKSYEQKLSDLMIFVRRTLTELLLEVTNEEIAKICEETIKKHKAKASSVRVIRKSALLSLTGKLGLAAYDDSSSDKSSLSSEGEDDSNQIKSNDGSDSEEELKAKIKAAKRTFAQTCIEIEERIAQSEMREEQKLKYYTEKENNEKRRRNENSIADRKNKSAPVCDNIQQSGSKCYEKDFGEPPDTKFHQTNGKRQKERMTRFSDNKDSRKTLTNYLPTSSSSQQSTEISKSRNTAKLNSPLSSSPISSATNDLKGIKQSNALNALNAMKTPTVEIKEPISAKISPLRQKHKQSSRGTSSSSSSSGSSSSCSEDSYKRRRGKERHRYSSRKSSRSSSRQRSTSSRRRRDSHSRDYKKRSSRKSSHYSSERHTSSSRNESKYSSKRRTHDRSSYDRSRSNSRSSSRSRSKSSYSSSRRKR